jgi:hypothetical protein
MRIHYTNLIDHLFALLFIDLVSTMEFSYEKMCIYPHWNTYVYSLSYFGTVGGAPRLEPTREISRGPDWFVQYIMTSAICTLAGRVT